MYRGAPTSRARTVLALGLIALCVLSLCSLDTVEAAKKRPRRNEELSGNSNPEPEVVDLPDDDEEGPDSPTRPSTPSPTSQAPNSEGEEEEEEVAVDASTSYYDDDEFEGVPATPPSRTPVDVRTKKPAAADKPVVAPPAMKMPPLWTPEFFRFFMFEWMGLGMIVVYIVMYYSGKSSLEGRASAWATSFANLFRDEFASVGITRGDGEGRALLLKESNSSFKFFASGRRNCRYMMGHLEFAASHDLLSVLYNLWAPTTDKLTLDVCLDKDGIEPFVFLACQSRLKKAIKEEASDLRSLGAEVPTPAGLDNITVHTDVPSLVSEFLHDDVIKAITQHKSLFQSMHFTDCSADRDMPQRLRFVFKIPSAKKMGDLKNLLKMVIHFIDKTANVKLGAHARDKCKKERLMLQQKREKALLEQRREEAERKRQEKAKKEKEEARRNLDLSTREKIEAQKRKEEKERKREKKNKGMKGGKVRMMKM